MFKLIDNYFEKQIFTFELDLNLNTFNCFEIKTAT